MTLNKYQKYNKNIRLDDNAREQILNNIMEADIRPARRSVPGWRFAAVFACVFAAFAFLIIPRSKPAQSESAAAYEMTDSAVLYESAADEPAEAESAAVFGADALSEALGYRIPDMDGYSAGSGAEYAQISDTAGQITLMSGGSRITILTDSAAEEKSQSGYEEITEDSGEAPAAYNSSVTAGAGSVVDRITFEHDGTVYTIFFEPAVSSEEAENIERYIRKDLQ